MHAYTHTHTDELHTVPLSLYLIIDMESLNKVKVQEHSDGGLQCVIIIQMEVAEVVVQQVVMLRCCYGHLLLKHGTQKCQYWTEILLSI